MWRALVFIGLLCLAAFGAVWLADHPGTVAITWNGREYLTSLAVGLIGVVVLAMVLALIWAAFRFMIGLPTQIGRNSRIRRRERGFAALSRGLIAIGAGDVAAAKRYASEAERLTGGEPLALLLRAQTAQAAGDRDGAETAFRRMLDHRETRILGLRGLFIEARRRGDAEAARISAEEAVRIAPSVAWANDAMLEAYSSEGDWGSAIRAVERRGSLGLSDKAEIRRHRAVLHAADAIAREKAHDFDGALNAAQEAIRLAPDLVPAAAVAGRILSSRGDLRRAAKVIETAWKTNQHPDLAAAYLNLRPGDSATDRLRRAETLARLSNWSAESRLAIGRAAIEAREFSRARETLRPLADERPTVRVCLMMAELEQAEGQPGRVREWLARAARAPRDKAWIADGIVSETWAPISPVTGKVDAFVWATPPEALGSPAPSEADFLDSALREPEPGPVVSLGAPATPAPVRPAMEPAPQKAAPAPGGAVDILSPPAEGATRPVTPPAKAEIKPMPIPDEPLPEPDKARPVSVAPAAKPELPRDPVRTATPNGTAIPPAGKTSREPEPVVFPFAHPPDDPGATTPETKRSLFRIGS
jgi:HemY protein